MGPLLGPSLTLDHTVSNIYHNTRGRHTVGSQRVVNGFSSLSLHAWLWTNGLCFPSASPCRSQCSAAEDTNIFIRLSTDVTGRTECIGGSEPSCGFHQCSSKPLTNINYLFRVTDTKHSILNPERCLQAASETKLRVTEVRSQEVNLLFKQLRRLLMFVNKVWEFIEEKVQVRPSSLKTEAHTDTAQGVCVYI